MERGIDRDHRSGGFFLPVGRPPRHWADRGLLFDSSCTRARHGDPIAIASQKPAFPTLASDDMHFLRSNATSSTYSDADVVSKADHPPIDFYAVESGELEIQNPTADD